VARNSTAAAPLPVHPVARSSARFSETMGFTHGMEQGDRRGRKHTSDWNSRGSAHSTRRTATMPTPGEKFRAHGGPFNHGDVIPTSPGHGRSSSTRQQDPNEASSFQMRSPRALFPVHGDTPPGRKLIYPRMPDDLRESSGTHHANSAR
jgi:hypothetical protein